MIFEQDLYTVYTATGDTPWYGMVHLAKNYNLAPNPATTLL